MNLVMQSEKDMSFRLFTLKMSVAVLGPWTSGKIN